MEQHIITIAVVIIAWEPARKLWRAFVNWKDRMELAAIHKIKEQG